MRLSIQTRINITRWAEEYIAGLVQTHNGDGDDVRLIIHDLYHPDRNTDEMTASDAGGGPYPTWVHTHAPLGP